MLVKNEQNLVNQLTEQIERLKAEIIELTHDRDKIFNDISEQRRGKTEVHTKKIVIQKEVSILEALFASIKKILKQEQKDFYLNTDKQKDLISKLNKEIVQKEKELEEYNKKELIDIDSKNTMYKELLREKGMELSKIEQSVSEYKLFIAEHDIKVKKTEEKLEKKENELKEFRKNLKKREKELEMREKRYSEFKEFLASNKK